MYKIIIDSCGELTDSLKKDGHFCNVALELDVDGYRIRDDESFDQHDFLRLSVSFFEVQSKFIRDYLSACQDSDILKHFFSSVTISRSFDSYYLEGSS